MRSLAGWILTLPLLAADYAVAPPPIGDESGDGRSKPMASVAKALGRAGSGDTVTLLRGATYREPTGTIPEGVTLRAAGDAAKGPPIITAAVVVPIGAWKPWSENPKVLVAPCEQPVLDAFADGRALVLARFPNLDKGWLRTAAGTTPDQIVAPDRAKVPKAAAGRWQGGTARWRRWSWWWESRPITADDGQSRLSLGPDNRFRDPMVGDASGFYVDNLLCELDAPGEWFHDSATKQLYVFPPEGSDPKSLVVEVVVSSGGWQLDGGTVDGVGFARFAGAALTIGRPSQVRGALFQDCATDAVVGTFDAFGTRIEGSTFRDVRNIGITWNENPGAAGGTVFERNRFERIGMRFGHGGSGSWKASGIVITNGKTVTVRRNTMLDVGYAGVLLGAPGLVVERNILVRCMASLNDGAAIYANSSKNRIHENIILDTIGNLDTSQRWYPLGHGIWMEFLSAFREHSIVGNTVYGSGGHGLFLTNNFQCEVRDNVFAGNRLGQIHLSPHGGSQAAQGHTVAGNVLAVQGPSRRLRFPEQIPDNWSANDVAIAWDIDAGIDYGSIQGTSAVLMPGAPYAKDDGRTWAEPADLAKERWGEPAPRLARAASLLLINDTEAPATVVPPGSGWLGMDGKPVGKGVQLAPFRSAVVLRPSSEDGLPPYVCASGTDWRAEPKDAPAAAKTPTKRKAPPIGGR